MALWQPCELLPILLHWSRQLPASMATLEVKERTSGRMISFPVVVSVINGERYLVSVLGEQIQWVQNVRAARGKAVFLRHGREEIHTWKRFS